MKYVNVDCEIDLYEQLDELTDDELQEYIDSREFIFQSQQEKEINYEELVDMYYHGDFDVDKFLKLIKWGE